MYYSKFTGSRQTFAQDSKQVSPLPLSDSRDDQRMLNIPYGIIW